MVGQNIGKYRVIDRIGRGGMGTVYRALDETLHRDVAIKVLNAELNDPGVARRFKAEAVTVARLNHPGIATIFELFQHEGQWLMVMEFLRGETLEALVMRTGPLDLNGAAKLCMQSLNALAHAHSLGVVHRDLKPANIMLTENGSIKIMDFGIARVSGTEHLTNAGFLMGTPAYMAPEQVMGGEVDARADLYAMGVVLFFLLSARLPFKGDTPFEMVQSRLRDLPMPVTSAREGLPGWIAQVLDMALARDPHKRLQSAPLFHEALRRGLANLPLDTPEPASAPPELIATVLPNSMPAVGPAAGPPTPSSTSRGSLPIAPTPVATAATAVSAPPTVSAPGLSSPPPGSTAPIQTPTIGASQPSPVTPPATVPSADAKAAGASPGRSRTIAVIGGIAALVVVLGSGGVWWWRSHRPAVPAPTTAAVPADQAPVTPSAPVENAPSAGSAPTVPPGTAPPPGGGATPAAAGPGASAPPPSAGAGGDPTLVPGASGATTAGPATPGAATAGRGRGRGGPATDPLLAFNDVRFISVAGRRTIERDVTVNFAQGHITVVGKKVGVIWGDIPYRDLVAATYVRAREPKWDAQLASPPADVDFPGGLFRTARRWLVLQSRASFLILRLGDSEWQQLIETVTARTGINVEQSAGH